MEGFLARIHARRDRQSGIQIAFEKAKAGAETKDDNGEIEIEKIASASSLKTAAKHSEIITAKRLTRYILNCLYT